MSNPGSRMTIKPLHPLFVAEITGIDLTQAVSREDFKAIWDAFNEHQILVIRDQLLDDESQIRFSSQWGTLERMEAHAANNYKPGHIAVMTNMGEDGHLLPLTHPAMVHRERNEAWHTDSSFKQVAALCSMLHARVVPPVGGNTDFATCRAAYDTLSAERKAQFESLICVHKVTTAEEGDKTRAYSDEQKKRLTVTHPLIRTNPANGRKNLYVGSHAQEVVGMSLAQGAALMDELTALCTQPQFVYSHPWRVHDLVIWDNRCVLHRATTFDKTKFRRKLHRTTVAGLTPDSAFARMPEAVAA